MTCADLIAFPATAVVLLATAPSASRIPARQASLDAGRKSERQDTFPQWPGLL